MAAPLTITADRIPGLETAAAAVLKRAVELDNDRRFIESLACYREGIAILMDVAKVADEAKRTKLRLRIEEYMTRAERLKTFIASEKDAGRFHEQVQIEAGSTGHSYETLFRPLIDDELREVEIEDPYIRAGHQLLNFVRFCELLIMHAPKLQCITLTTGADDNPEVKAHQVSALRELTDSLKLRNVSLKVYYDPALHDREIRFDNGWIVKIGRGLDYFRSVSKYSLGSCEFDLRPCHATTVDIFHRKYAKMS